MIKCPSCKFSHNNTKYDNCSANPDSPTYNDNKIWDGNDCYQPIEENKMSKPMDCRSKNCRLHSEKHDLNCKREFMSREPGFCDAQVTWYCKIYKKLLPLWKFQDIWVDKTSDGNKYEITESLDDSHYYGRISVGGVWLPVCWNNKGKISTNTCNGSGNLISKSKQWYGVVDNDNNLLKACTKDYLPYTTSKIIKLKEDK